MGIIRMMSPSDTDVSITVQLAGTTNESSVTVWTPEQTPSTFKPSALKEETTEAQDIERRKKQIAALSLRGTRKEPKPGGWRNIVGKFDNDPMIRKISEEGRRLRESE